jgi:hypothetical protein
MVCFAVLITFQQCLQLDDECHVFEFEIHNTKHVRSELAALASSYNLGGSVKRISNNCVLCKVVSTLDNAKNFQSFLGELRTFGKNLVQRFSPKLSEDDDDINIAFSRHFIVHAVPVNFRDINNPSPDMKGNVPWENVEVVSARSGSDRAL